MGFVWGLAVHLLFFCWKARVTVGSPGLTISTSVPLVTTNNMDVLASTPRDRPSSEGASQTTEPTRHLLDTESLSIEAASNTFIEPSASSEVSIKDTQTTFPTASSMDTQTTSPAASSMNTQTTSPAASSMDTQTTSPTASSLDTKTTSPTASSIDTQTTSPAASSMDTQTTSPTASSMDTQTTSPTASSMDTQTTSPTASSMDTQTTSPTASSMGTQTTSPTASSMGTQTTSPAASSMDTQTTSPIELTLKLQTISSVTETRTLAVRIPSNFMAVHTIPTETSARSDSPTIGMSTAKTGTVSGPVEAIFDTLCTDDSSEEASKITADLLALAHSSTEAEHLSSESSSSSDSSGGVLGSSWVLEPNTATAAKDLVAFSITHTKLTTCVTEIETSVIVPGTPDTNYNPTEVTTALSTSEMLNLPQSTEATPLISETASSSGILSIASTPAFVTALGGTLSTSGTTERETAVAQMPTSGGTLVPVSRNPLEDLAPSTETQSHTELLGTITVPRVAGSTVGEATTFASSSAPHNSLSAVATTKSSTPSDTVTTDNTTNPSFLTGSRPLPFVYVTTVRTSKKPNVTLAKPTASPKTPTQPPRSTATTASTRKTTKRDLGEGGGLLLVRLSVASRKDLTEPKAAKKLMDQLLNELRARMPLVQVTLLSVRRA
ncbi:mucin-20 [Acomys russatus]|uniref:mucin-20 n=1 Tax=Acomys russatus TaxID=60746 RepID=UPI0021E25250|nr:mucin-20 [Acomys russatus]